MNRNVRIWDLVLIIALVALCIRLVHTNHLNIFYPK